MPLSAEIPAPVSTRIEPLPSQAVESHVRVRESSKAVIVLSRPERQLREDEYDQQDRDLSNGSLDSDSSCKSCSSCPVFACSGHRGRRSTENRIIKNSARCLHSGILPTPPHPVQCRRRVAQHSPAHSNLSASRCVST